MNDVPNTVHTWGWEFRQWRISFALPSVSKLPPLYGEEANPLALRATDDCGYLFQSKRPPQGWSFALEQMTGIEPAFLAWEANALPLSYICIFNLRQLLYRKARGLSMPFLNFVPYLCQTKSDTRQVPLFWGACRFRAEIVVLRPRGVLTYVGERKRR